MTKIEHYISVCGINAQPDSLVSINKNLNDDIVEEFAHCAEQINEMHITHCDCCDKKKKEIYENEVKKYLDDKIIELKEMGRELSKQQLNDIAKTKVIELTAMHCSSQVCPVEQKQIINILLLFAKKYDLKDPRAFLIIKSTINHMLSAFRMQRYSNKEGILNIWYDKQGNRRLSVNPVEERKMEFDKAVIDAISTLDKIFEGNKNVNLNLSITPKDVDDIFIDTNFVAGDYNEVK